jgi:hypothetical protein
VSVWPTQYHGRLSLSRVASNRGAKRNNNTTGATLKDSRTSFFTSKPTMPVESLMDCKHGARRKKLMASGVARFV